MSIKPTSPFKEQTPTLVLLLIIALIAGWYFLSGLAAQVAADVPVVSLITGLVLVVVGFAAGVLGGLIGTGGCSLMLPVIHFWMGYPAPIAVGTTLFAVIFTAISGGYGHLVRRNLDVKAVLWLGGVGILGVILGSWLFTLLAAHSALLGLILGLIFLWPAIRMIWEGIVQRKMPQREGNMIPGPVWGWAIFGFIVGIATGVAGVGGGYALVPGLIYLFGAPVYITMGSSLATMIPLAVVGGGIKLFQGFVDVGAGLLLAIGTIVGAQVGSAIIKRFKPSTLKLIFGLYFLYVAVKFITAYFGILIW
ncbi:MAG: sulfite exporter TauE/SafE family protein [Anaerolineales bacterium]|nr:sulfite exporter TauE/SafE family protein [Anaerolineales bacterium]